MSHFASVKDRKSCFYFLTRNQISLLLLGIPGDSDGKCGRPGFNPWVGKIPWRSVWPSTLVFLPGKFHGQRSLTSYRPWGHKELDTTEWITHTHTHTHTPLCCYHIDVALWWTFWLSPGEGNGNPLQYFCLGNPRYREAWRGIVHGVEKELDMTYNNKTTDIYCK